MAKVSLKHVCDLCSGEWYNAKQSNTSLTISAELQQRKYLAGSYLDTSIFSTLTYFCYTVFKNSVKVYI